MANQPYASRRTNKRNAAIVAASSLALYVLSALLWVKGGWDAAFAPLLVAVVVDAICIVVYLSFRSKHRK
ncbi:hypothetical protein [Streptomyces sp. NPDC057694]|uniref:hypothetical protein n=1 Tax=Streptomyces sp. NPDC057694 TaxID=3346216 RepID=UPI00369C0F93